ncbi:hypothetical protein PZB74_03245 [Porifericola rhodea]|uniref:toxin-antitoxin system YwqK family antitoxin n=1 Tax=Porifericola rhodea TaxID=930972 RepID=UPI002667070D|nr:hypothetical protein [Porifericola rhodea]WKN32367.1 hypothetical protein PZB74_03245 [Porifericola rhodea]
MATKNRLKKNKMKNLMIVLLALFLSRCISSEKKNEEVTNIKRTYFESGKLKAEAEFNSDSLKHGFANLFYENGQKKLQTVYQNGEKNGLEIKYFNSGNIEYKMTYHKGIPIGEMFEYYEDGQLKYYSFYDPAGKGIYRAYYDINGIFLKEEGVREPLNLVNTLTDFEYQIGDTLDLIVYVPNPPNFNQHIEIKIFDETNNQRELNKMTIENGKVYFKNILNEKGTFEVFSTLFMENNLSKEFEEHSTNSFTFIVK